MRNNCRFLLWILHSRRLYVRCLVCCRQCHRIVFRLRLHGIRIWIFLGSTGWRTGPVHWWWQWRFSGRRSRRLGLEVGRGCPGGSWWGGGWGRLVWGGRGRRFHTKVHSCLFWSRGGVFWIGLGNGGRRWGRNLWFFVCWGRKSFLVLILVKF